MPLNPSESYYELTKYHQFYCSMHSAFQLSSINFTKVPENTIIITSFNDNSLSSYDQKILFYDIIDNKNYLIDCLLTENSDIPEIHKLHNKTIYMPGSCIPNIAIEFNQHKGESVILGIFDIENLYNNNEYDLIDYSDGKSDIDIEKLNKSSIVKNNMKKSLFLQDIVKMVNDYSPGLKLIFVDGCTDINHDPEYLLMSKLSKRDHLTLLIKDEDKLLVDLSTTFTKYNRTCVLDSLQKFTNKFSFYEKSPLDFSNYNKIRYNFRPTEIYKKKYKQEIKDVDKYFSKLPNIEEEDEDEHNIYYNLSTESKGSISGTSSLKPRSSSTNEFDKYLGKEVKEILYGKKSRRRSPSKNIESRRSKRIASARKMYDGKKSRRRSPSKNIESRRSKRKRITSAHKMYYGKKSPITSR